MLLLVATTNPAKVREIRAILEGPGLRIQTLAEYPPVDPPEETGLTFADNARIKALYYAAAFGQLTVAEDSGLEIDALGGRPGVESARFGGAETSYPEKFALIYAAGGANSPARFVCALALARAADVSDTGRIRIRSRSDPGRTRLRTGSNDAKVIFEARGTVEGLIAAAPKGDGGFGYDPIFYYPPLGCTLAEAGDRKSEVSHRAAAFRALRAFLARG